MAASTNTHRSVGVAPNPWLGRILVVLAVLAAAWLVVTVVDTGDTPGSGPPEAVQAPTAAQAAATARMTGQADAGAYATSPAPAVAAAPTDIFEVRDLDLLAGPATVAPTAAPTPSDIFEFRQFHFIPGSGPAAVDLAAYDLVSGTIPDIVPFDQQQAAEALAGYDLASGDIPDIAPFDRQTEPIPNPRYQMR